MTDETLGNLAAILSFIFIVGIGLLVLFIEPIDRWLDKMKKKRAMKKKHA